IVFENPTPANVRGAIQIQNNTIFNLTSNQNFAASGATANVVGIDFNLSGNSETAITDISGNTIYGLTTNGSTAITNAVGIYYSGRSAGTQTINGNFIRDFNSTNINQSQTGIEAAGGLATYSNNIVYLGRNGTADITTHNIFNGISETGGTNQFYFNTATLGGTATVAGANNTFAFITTVNAGTRNISNNIFFNARSNTAGTSKHYAISLPGNTGLTINNNNYFVSGTGGVLGRYNGVDNATLVAWQGSTTQDGASQSVNPALTANILNGTGTSTATNFRPTGAGIIAGAAIAGVTTDYSGTQRTCNNSLGAFEIAPTAPNLQISNPAAVCSPNTVNLNAVGIITDLNGTTGVTEYFTSLANAISNTSPTAITTPVSTSGTYFIRKTAGCGYDVKPVTVTINPLPSPSFTVSSSNICAGSTGVVFTTQSGMLSYTWNISGTGNSITSGSATNSILTAWGSNGGNVTLNYTDPNGCSAASAISQAVTITPRATPTFTVTGASPVCQGATLQTFTTQTGRSNYLWSVVGGTITAGGGPTNNSATITWNTPGTGIVAVNYSNAASPLCFASTYTQSNITVNATTAITSQPTAPAAICEGSGTQTLSVMATGVALSYSWRRNGAVLSNGGVISGQGTNTLTLTNPLIANAGNYDVIVTGSCGSPITSSAVSVVVNAAPSVSVQPSVLNISYMLNQAASDLSVTATAGSGTITGYQWWSNTTATTAGATLLTGATGSTYTPSTASIGTLYYFCVITNSNGCSVNSAISGAITVYPIPNISAVTGTTPLVSGQSPFTGYRGQTLTITGSNFASNATLSINGVNATVTFVNSTQLTAVVNNSGASVVSNIVVTNPTGGAFSSQPFSFIGYITNTASDWATPSAWLGGSLPLNNATATIAHATSCSTTVAETISELIVQAPATLTLSGATAQLACDSVSLNGTLAFNGTGLLDISKTFTLGGSAIFNCDNGTVRYSGSADQILFSGPASLTYNNLTLAGSGNKSLSASADLTALNVVVNAGSTLRIQDSNNDVFLNGDFSVNGSLNAEAGTIHFTGTSDQNIAFAGAGPLTFNNLRNAKTAGVLRLNGNIKVNNSLSLEQGNINTLGNILELGKDLTQTGSLNYTAGMVHGIMRRWFAAGTNSGVASGFFPMGQLIASSWKGRGALLEYTSAPTTGGHLTVEFMPIPMINGALGGQTFIPAGSTGGAGFQVSNFSNDGYWKIDNQSGTLTDGLYSLALTGEGFSMPNGLTQVTMAKRVGTGNWFCPGTHLAPTGTASVPTLRRSGITGFSNFGYAGGPNNPLPVTLLSFEATCTAGEITATWTTASETNNRMFLIEQSSDAMQWTAIDTLSGSGNSNALRSYTSQFTAVGAGVSYIRLLQIDFNGASETFDPVYVQCSETAANEIIIYPNAVSDVANVELRASEPLDVQVMLYSCTGQLLRTVPLSLKQGSNFTRLDVSDLSRGIYHVVLSNAKQLEFIGSRYLIKQ
ncbi:MAG: T9SS type A sorting domain-containing protein, partial [Bacteroidia bacterium]